MEEKKTPVPLYAYRDQLDKRYKIIKSIGISEEDKNIFNLLCEYAAAHENAVINLEKFLAEYSKMKSGKKLRYKITLNMLSALVNVFQKMELDILTYASSTDGSVSFSEILLKEPPTEIEQELKRVNKFIENKFQLALENKNSFPSLFDINKKFSSVSQSIKILLDQMKVQSLSFASLHLLAEKEKKPLMIDLGEELGYCIFPISKIQLFPELFIDLISEYFFNKNNLQLQKVVRKKLQEKNLSIANFQEFFHIKKIHSSFFIFFIQLYYNIFSTFQQRLMHQGTLNTGVKNQLIAAFILMHLAGNQRDVIKKKKVRIAKEESYKDKIIKNCLENSVTLQGKVVYVPIALYKIYAIPVALEKENSKELDSIPLSQAISKKKILNFISQYNTKESIVKELISFQALGETFFLHRFRLLSAALGLIQEERESVFSLFVKKWKENPDQLFQIENQQQFMAILQQENNITPFFSAFYNFISKFITQIRHEYKNYSASFLQTKLFPTEHEIMNWKAINIFFPKMEDSQKEKIISSFLEAFVDPKTSQIKSCFQAIEISFEDLKKSVIQSGPIGLHSILFYKIKSILQLKKLCEDIGNFFSQISFRNKNKNSLPNETFNKPQIELSQKSSPENLPMDGMAAKFLEIKDDAPTTSPATQNIENPNTVRTRAALQEKASHKISQHEASPPTAAHEKNSEAIEPAAQDADKDADKDVDLQNPKKDIHIQENKLSRTDQKKALIKQFPLLKNNQEIEKKIEKYLDLWNLKIGKSHAILQETVDQRIDKIIKRFDFHVFSGDIKTHLYGLLNQNDKVFKDISNKNALAKYVYYRAYQMKFQSLDKHS